MQAWCSPRPLRLASCLNRHQQATHRCGCRTPEEAAAEAEEAAAVAGRRWRSPHLRTAPRTRQRIKVVIKRCSSRMGRGGDPPT